MTTLFRKQYPRRSRVTELLFLILFIVLLIPIFPFFIIWLMGKIVEPIVELYIDITWEPFRVLHNRINPYKES